MRMTLLALAVLVLPATAVAQVNTTGSLSPNTTTVQGTTPTTTTTTPSTVTTPTTTLTAPSATGNAATGAATGAATPTAAARDAAIVTCGAEFSTGVGRLLVTSASTSASVPAIAVGGPCAQALSDLFVAGFGVIDVLPANQQVVYTLVR